VDGANVREDTKPVLGAQQIPILSATENGGTAVGGLPQFSHLVRTRENCTAYVPEFFPSPIKAANDPSPFVTIIKRDADIPFGPEASPIHKYLSLSGTPLEKNLEDLKQGGYQPMISRDQIDGRQYTLLEYQFPKSEMASKIWIARDQGCLIKRAQQFYKQKLVREHSVNLKSFGDTYAFDKVEDASWKTDGTPVDKVSYTIKNFDLTATFDANTFSIGVPGQQVG
jgi:hypothetical protein